MKAKDNIHYVLVEHFGKKLEQEYKFSDVRKFRFDWAVPEAKLAFEYEGIFSEKSRHTTATGYAKDTEKYNLAQLEGWTVLRYTSLNYQQLTNDLRHWILENLI